MATEAVCRKGERNRSLPPPVRLAALLWLVVAAAGAAHEVAVAPKEVDLLVDEKLRSRCPDGVLLPGGGEGDWRQRVAVAAWLRLPPGFEELELGAPAPDFEPGPRTSLRKGSGGRMPPAPSASDEGHGDMHGVLAPPFVLRKI